MAATPFRSFVDRSNHTPGGIDSHIAGDAALLRGMSRVAALKWTMLAAALAELETLADAEQEPVRHDNLLFPIKVEFLDSWLRDAICGELDDLLDQLEPAVGTLQQQRAEGACVSAEAARLLARARSARDQLAQAVGSHSAECN